MDAELLNPLYPVAKSAVVMAACRSSVGIRPRSYAG
jgi:hypothetical protein